MRVSLAAKLAIWLVAGAAVICIGFGYLNLRLQRKQLEETVLESADRITDIIQRSTRYEMLQNDRAALYQSIDDMGTEPGIRRIRIFNKEGRISFSTWAKENGSVVDKQMEACYGCHQRNEPLTKLDRKDRSRTFTFNGERVLGVIRPIENEAACWNAACHAHPQSQRVLGVIDTHLSLAHVDARAAQSQAQVMWATLLALALVCVFTLLFAWRVVYRRVRELIDGTRKVAQGDLSYRLPVRSRDELGEMAESFNKMTLDLEKANSEIMAWTRTLEERAEKKAKELEKAHEFMAGAERMASLGKLAATVAHEVNNPLMGILTYARLTRKAIDKADPAPPDKERLIEQLQIIEHESRRCGDLMRNLLMFARQSSRTLQHNDINSLVSRAVLLVRHQLELNGIELEQNMAPDLPEVTCDAGQIQQIVLGLLVNATEAMPPNSGGKLWVSTLRIADPEGIAIMVRDDGPGIAPEVLPHVFEPFFTTKTDEQRTGLGLAVAKSIVEQHGGEISVKSAPGEGAEFTIRLTLEGAAAVPEPQLSGASV
jgi:two-component system NtrC family sensor kinase